MSFNLLVSARKQADIYDRILLRQERLDPAVSTISNLHPGVIGLQEVSDEHRSFFESSSFLSDYGMVGSPMKPDLHEQGVYVMYDRVRYNLQDWGIRWLSEAPDEEHSYLKEAMDENRYRLETAKGIMHQPRKVVYAVLEDCSTRRAFAFCNTHLGHTPPGSEPAVSDHIRFRQAEILTDLILNGDMFDSQLPFAIAGDMNSQPDMPPHEAYSKIAADAAEAAAHRPPVRQITLHSYRRNPRPNYIDYIFWDRRNFLCDTFEVITNPYYSAHTKTEILPSDHYALISSASLKN